MTESQLRQIAEGVEHEIRVTGGWAVGSQHACRELVAEVRQLQEVIVRQNLTNSALRGTIEEALVEIGHATSVPHLSAATKILKEALR